jgi:hypothetical protein
MTLECQFTEISTNITYYSDIGITPIHSNDCNHFVSLNFTYTYRKCSQFEEKDGFIIMFGDDLCDYLGQDCSYTVENLGDELHCNEIGYNIICTSSSSMLALNFLLIVAIVKYLLAIK